MITEKCISPQFINGTWVSCGKCSYCKAKRQLNWTVRGKHESLTNPKKIFLTLTYNDQNLIKSAKKPENPNDCLGTLKPKHLQDFLKRLRKYIYTHIRQNLKIKYIASGEYGGQDRKNEKGELCGKWRPHYHLIIYGLEPGRISQNKLTEIWGKGHAYLDKKPYVNSKAVAYTVGYINKKMVDNKGWEHYEKNGRIAPFQRQSKGIGKDWAEANPNWYKNLKTGYNGNSCSIPRYYIKKVYEEEGKKVKIINKVIELYLVHASNEDIKQGKAFKLGEKDETWYKYIRQERDTVNYKVFKNPYGTKTQEILRQLNENALKTLENVKKRYNISDKEYEVIKARKIADMEQKKMIMLEEWNDVNTLTKEDLQEKYHHETYRRYNMTEKKIYFKKNEYDEGTFEKMITEAMKKNEEIEGRTKKFNRDGDTISEEIKDFIKNFKL